MKREATLLVARVAASLRASKRARTPGPGGGLLLNFAAGGTPAQGFENSDVTPFSDRQDVRHVNLDHRPLPYADGVAGVILISHGLCLRPAKREILAEFARILRPGGWLRIDDNPNRFWVNEQQAAREADPGAGRFSEELMCSRQQLFAWLDELGFEAREIAPEETHIPLRGKLRRAVLRNRQFHESFTVEAVKR